MIFERGCGKLSVDGSSAKVSAHRMAMTSNSISETGSTTPFPKHQSIFKELTHSLMIDNLVTLHPYNLTNCLFVLILITIAPPLAGFLEGTMKRA
jgi:hypothetical protein